MPNVTIICVKCNYEFLTNVKSIDDFMMRIPGTNNSCPRCRRKRWLRLVKPGIRAGVMG